MPEADMSEQHTQEVFVKLTRVFLAIGSLALVGLAFIPRSWASESDRKTVLTVDKAIQVPNAVLQPGTYVLKLLDSPGNRNIVQIFNADETELITTILAIPNQRLEVTEKSAFQFWETPPGQPPALRSWFYPGWSSGQEFAYPKIKAVAIAAVSKAEVPSTEAKAPEEFKTAEVVEVTPQGTVEPAPAAPAPVETAQAIPPPAPVEGPAPAPETKLPKTGSPYPMIGLAGLVLLSAFGTVRLIRAK